MLTSQVVEFDLSILKSSLPWAESGFVQGLDGVFDVGFNIVCSVYSAICTDTEDASQLDPVHQDLTESILWVAWS